MRKILAWFRRHPVSSADLSAWLDNALPPRRLEQIRLHLATCPELPPMTAFGETLSEARSNAAEEIAAWLDAHSASFDVTAEQWARRFV